MTTKQILLIACLVGLSLRPLSAQQEAEPIGTTMQSDSILDCGIFIGSSLINRSLVVSVPMLALSLPYMMVNHEVRSIRHEHLPQFRHRYDDYLQFAPLAGQFGLKALGIEGRSRTWGEMLTADALGAAIMMGSVTLVKNLSRIERPDGSSRNSFPSGHTAMAFASATLLHLEYGKRHPWLSAIGYLTAGSVGVGRVLNNRHWVGDVVMGMNVGIVSAELGYYFSSRIYRGRRFASISQPMLKNVDVRLSLPWFASLGAKPQSAGVGLGARVLFPESNYFTQLDLAYEVYKLPKELKQEALLRSQRLRLGVGRTWQELLHYRASLDLMTALAVERGCVYPSLQITPRWQFSPRLAYTLGLSYDYRPAFPQIEGLVGQHGYHRHRFYISSGFELRI